MTYALHILEIWLLLWGFAIVSGIPAVFLLDVFCKWFHREFPADCGD